MPTITTEELVPYDIALFYKRLDHGTKLFYLGLYETACFIKTNENWYYFITDKGIDSVRIS